MLLPAQIAIAAANYRPDIHLFSDLKGESKVEGGHKPTSEAETDIIGRE